MRILLLVSLLGSLVVVPTPASANDTATRWEWFSESSGCGSAYTRPPFASRSGYLSDAEAVLGPFGTYFGRSVGELRSSQATWMVPFSGGRLVKVHKDALPAFQQVSQNLMSEAGEGRIYWVHTVGAFTPRTVGGEYQVSRHAFGTAIDINPAQNPYRSSGPLITDMPAWYVEAWTAAGFCWGGDWLGEKDAMHFSWMGPGSGFGNPIDPLPPKTAKRAYGPVDGTYATVMGPVLERYVLAIGAATGNGGPNVAGIRSHGDGAVLDVASGYESFGSCSVRRWFLEDGSQAGDDHLVLMDVDGDSRQDLVTLRRTGGATEIQISKYQSDFEEVETMSRPLGDVVAVAGADFDADRIADLWVATGSGTLDIYRGPDFATLLDSQSLPSGSPDQVSVADRDGGDLPEVFAYYDTAPARVEVLSWGGIGWENEQTLPLAVNGDKLEALAAMDYDGDGRADLLTLDGTGFLEARVGNTPTGSSTTSWFVDASPNCRNRVQLVFEGTFYDDEGNTHVQSIEWIAAEGITLGCNPPFNDAFCPDEKLTRAQAAAFVVRALDLPETSSDFFVDDGGLTLEEPINQLAAAGITRGCNPPANDRFCPTRVLTRGEFATFLVRALSLPTTSDDYFRDDLNHTHEGAINRLAASGVTRGCNPPTNDRYCPNRPLTRAETATFFARAFG